MPHLTELSLIDLRFTEMGSDELFCYELARTFPALHRLCVKSCFVVHHGKWLIDFARFYPNFCTIGTVLE